MTEVLTGWGHAAAMAVVLVVGYVAWRFGRDTEPRNPGWHDYE